MNPDYSLRSRTRVRRTLTPIALYQMIKTLSVLRTTGKSSTRARCIYDYAEVSKRIILLAWGHMLASAS
jgi:hypothetical protein